MNVLLLGEGDFSFTYAIHRLEKSRQNWLQLMGIKESCDEEKKIVSSSLDSESEVLLKYPNFSNFSLPNVIHGVNAIDPHVYERLCPSLVIWNHPHLGTEDARLHAQLIRHFFQAIPPEITVILSFIPNQFERWRVVEAANKFGFKLAGKTPFVESQFPGYTARRNLCGTSFKNLHAQANWQDNMASMFYVFVPNHVECDVTISEFPTLVSPVEIFACPHCDKTYRSAQGVRTHISQFHERKQIVSSTCKVDNSKKGLEAKSFTSTQEKNENTLWCPICEESVDLHHVERFGQNNVSIFTCSFCRKEFREKRALDQHLLMKH